MLEYLCIANVICETHRLTPIWQSVRELQLSQREQVTKCSIAVCMITSKGHCYMFAPFPVAVKGPLSIHSTYYENFLALSVGLRVNKHQLKMDHTKQAPVLRYRNVTITSEFLKQSLTAVCPVLGAHNIARVRRGILVLFEVDFADMMALEKFCKSLDGKLTESSFFIIILAYNCL